MWHLYNIRRDTPKFYTTRSKQPFCWSLEPQGKELTRLLDVQKKIYKTKGIYYKTLITTGCFFACAVVNCDTLYLGRSFLIRISINKNINVDYKSRNKMFPIRLKGLWALHAYKLCSIPPFHTVPFMIHVASSTLKKGQCRNSGLIPLIRF